MVWVREMAKDGVRASCVKVIARVRVRVGDIGYWFRIRRGYDWAKVRMRVRL